MKNLILLSLIFSTLFIQEGIAEESLPPTPTIYVDRDAIGGLSNGTSWTNAFTDIQDALDVYTNEDIWVAGGMYKPSKDPFGNLSTSSRDRTFFLPDGIKIYGGFDGTETNLAARDVDNHTTILSGDFNNDDNFDASNNGYQSGTGNENAYHIILAVTNTSGMGVTVDGFSITGGNANNNTSITVNGQSVSGSYGSGICIYAGTNILTNNTIHSNSAGFGGGIYTSGGTNIISNNIIYSNSTQSGGGIHTYTGTNTINDNIIHSNIATNFGGGLNIFVGTNTISNNTIYSNIAINYEGGGIRMQGGTHTVNNNNIYSNSTLGTGGGVHIESGNTITLDNNTIHLNTAQVGAGVNIEIGSHILNNNIIHSNSATTLYGGGINIKSDSNILNNNILYSNSATNSGGGIYIDSETNVLNNNVLYSNSANKGGGIFIQSGTNTFNNNTFYSNHALASIGRNGGGIHNRDGIITLRNSIFWENTTQNNSNVADADIYNDNGTLSISYCLTQENSNYSTGAGIINNQDPLFINAADPDGADDILGTADDGLALQDCSPAINTGTAISPTLPMDILGNNRVGAYDMGAYEFQTPFSTASLATSNTTVNLSQTNNTFYTNNCSSLIARIQQSGASPISGNVEAKVWLDASVMQAGQPYVQRHFEITPAMNTSTGTVTLYFLQSEFDAFNADPTSTNDLPTGPADATGIANLKITKYAGTSSDGTGNPSTYGTTPLLIDPADSDIVWNTTMNRWEVSFDVNGFSGFFAHGGSTPLPVEMTHFQAEKKGQTSLLTWETASEENNLGFLVERSLNGLDFEIIGWERGTGTTAEAQKYSFVDKNPMNGINYYRLVQEDFDGTSSTSDVRKVEFSKSLYVNLFPNPVKTGNGITLQIDAEKEGTTDIHIIDLAGKQISSTNLELETGMNNTTLKTQDLAEGIYFLRLMNNGEMQTLKFSVSH